MTNPLDPGNPEVRPPFWLHRYYYLALKLAVLAFGLYVAARLLGYV